MVRPKRIFFVLGKKADGVTDDCRDAWPECVTECTSDADCPTGKTCKIGSNTISVIDSSAVIPEKGVVIGNDGLAIFLKMKD